MKIRLSSRARKMITSGHTIPVQDDDDIHLKQ